MAFRLARYVEHTADVDGMLREITPEQMDEWLAYHSLEPIDGSHSRETLTLVGTSICRGLGMEVTPDDLRIDLDKPTTGPRQTRQKPLSVAGLKANLAAFVAAHNSGVM